MNYATISRTICRKWGFISLIEVISLENIITYRITFIQWLLMLFALLTNMIL